MPRINNEEEWKEWSSEYETELYELEETPKEFPCFIFIYETLPPGDRSYNKGTHYPVILYRTKDGKDWDVERCEEEFS